MAPRIEPVSEPYAPDVAARLAALMPPGEPPIRLFRTFVRNLPMAAGLNAWGGYYLSRKLSLSLRERELVIDRTTARCGCEYEWGVHIAFYADRVELTPEQIRSLAHGTAAACERFTTDELAVVVRFLAEMNRELAHLSR